MDALDTTRGANDIFRKEMVEPVIRVEAAKTLPVSVSPPMIGQFVVPVMMLDPVRPYRVIVLP